MLLSFLLSAVILTGPPGGVPPGLAKKGGLPPGQAKKAGGVPPGLAKKFGRRAPDRPYVAFDPRHTDRAWFLIDGRWELRQGLTGSVSLEIRDALRLPAAPPPVPLPRNLGIDLHVVLFD